MVSALVKCGVTMFFGVPGGAVSPVFKAIIEHPGATLIESRHETAAAFSAIDYYRSSGHVPVVVVTAGPGVTNVTTGVASAMLERTPMLLICGDVAHSSGRRLLQDSGRDGLNVESVFSSLTCSTSRATSAHALEAQALKALEDTCQHKKPSLFVVPIELSHIDVQKPATIQNKNDDISFVVNHLLSSIRPLLVVGTGCRNVSKLQTFIEFLGVPFVTTPQAKGIISEEHPLSLRHGGLAASMWSKQYTKPGVDLTIVLGSDLDDCSIGPISYSSKNCMFIHVDVDARVFSRNIETSVGIISSVQSFIDKVMNLCVKQGVAFKDRSFLINQTKKHSPFENLPETSLSVPITPWRVIYELEKRFASAHFITDIGEHMLSALHYCTSTKDRPFTIHLGLGSMGSGIAGSIGLALAQPQRLVVCICGDGGMQMMGSEVLTAIKHNLSIIFVVFNDARYNMVYHGYRQVFQKKEAWETGMIDFESWARSMSLNSALITKPNEIQNVVYDGGPMLLDVRINRDVHVSGGGRNEALLHMSMGGT